MDAEFVSVLVSQAFELGKNASADEIGAVWAPPQGTADDSGGVFILHVGEGKTSSS